MESSSSPAQRSNNNTPHHHYYSSAEQPQSFTNSIISNHSQLSYLNNQVSGESIISNNNVRRTTPRLYTPTNVSNGGRKNRSRTESPSVHSSGGGSNILDNNIISPALLSHHIHNISDTRINTSGTNSNSITPPNSNSNTTISCGSGNSTSANIGVPTTPKTTLNHNNNHVKRKTDLENVKNKSSPKPKAKKCILEEEDNDDVEKCVKKNKNKARTRTSWAGVANQEFLPICDALFNVISLAAYFCDIVFDVLTAYTWYKLSQETEEFITTTTSEDASGQEERSKALWQWSIMAIVFIGLSTLLSQCLSFKWYKESRQRGQIGPDRVELEGPPPPCTTGALLLMHLSLCGVLWRYFKLFIPVDLRFVKNEVRDLCLLRLVHAFCEAVPMLLIQLYLIWSTQGPQAVSDFTVVSTSLSLFSVCWALASFSKNIRKQNVHKLVLTWLGVIFQFFWHLGTIISRVVALSLYATVYHFWIFLVLILHWFCMLMWLISPKNLYHGEKISTLRKITYSALIAIVYTFCYVNVQERNSRQKVIIYYVIMFLENTLLLSVWLIAKRYEDEIWYKTHVISAVFFCFAGGILFMCLYYRYFHLKRLSYVYDTSSSIYRSSSMLDGGSTVNINGAIYSSPIGKGMRGDTSGGSALESTLSNSKSKNKNDKIQTITTTELGSNSNNFGEIISNGGSTRHHLMKKVPERYNKRNGSTPHDKNGLKSDKISSGNAGGWQRGVLYNKINGHHIHHPNVPGVFNCRFHPAMKRKKKKPTSFVPPPPAVQPASSTSPAVALQRGNHETGNHTPSQDSHQSSSRMGNNDRTHNTTNTFDQSDHNNEMGISYTNNNNDPSDDVSDNDHRNLSPDYVGVGANGSLSFDPSGPVGSSSSYGKMPIMFPSGGGGGRMLYPFWKRPLSITLGSENEGSVCSRVDIQQKLQEKKQKQLLELREIEEEIKQGKLKRPQFNEIPQPVTPTVRQSIPVEKKQPWFRAHGYNDENSADPPMLIHPRPPFIIPASADANEVILDPQYLMYASPNFDGSDCCYYDNPDWPINYYEPLYQNDDMTHQQPGGMLSKRKNPNNRSSKESIYKSYRMPSDIDSQMSLPRSYTLPREFKYKRKFRKPIKTEQFLPSTNSSDGDVDSGEEDPEIYSHLGPSPLPLPSMHHVNNNNNNNNNNNFPTTSSASAPQPSKNKNPIGRRHRLHETKL